MGSGSAGNALVVHTRQGAILVDAGFSGRELQRRLQHSQIDESDILGIVVSHEHQDHVKGLRVLARRWDVPVYANSGTAAVVRRKHDDFPAVKLFSAGQSFDVGPFRVLPFSIPHDAADPVAFAVEAFDHKIGIATDLGHVSHVTEHHLRDCEALVLESNHDPAMLRDCDRPWRLKRRIMSRHGHLSNEASMELLRAVLAARTRHVVLAHASRECNRYDLIESTVADCLGAVGRSDIAPLVARQDEPAATCWLE